MSLTHAPETLSPTITVPSLSFEDAQADFQAGPNAYFDLFPLQSLRQSITPHQEIGEYPSPEEADMIPQARYAVDLLPLLPHQSIHQVTTWHLYCDGSHHTANAKFDEACAMAIVVVE